VINGVIRPVVEELNFRGHQLPRIDRFGRGVPILNAVLFSIYHVWTLWQNAGRILALIPWMFTVWPKRSLTPSLGHPHLCELHLPVPRARSSDR
jgi:hypothetical protein